MDEQAKRSALRSIPNALFVIGTCSGRKRDDPASLHAFIGSWASQCSFDPPLVMFGLKRATKSHAWIQESRIFTMNFLAPSQKDVAKAFFQELNPTPTTLGGIPYEVTPSGAPIFPSLAGHLECKVVAFHEDGGDHDIVVGQVVGASFRSEQGAVLTVASSGWHYGG